MVIGRKKTNRHTGRDEKRDILANREKVIQREANYARQEEESIKELSYMIRRGKSII